MIDLQSIAFLSLLLLSDRPICTLSRRGYFYGCDYLAEVQIMMGEIFRICIRTRSFYILKTDTFKVYTFSLSGIVSLKWCLKINVFLWACAQVVLTSSFRALPWNKEVLPVLCVLQTPPPTHTPVSITNGLPHPHELCIWSWHLYLPHNGPSCISAISEIDCTSHTSPSRLPYLHVLVHTSSARSPFFSSRQPFKPTSGVCSVPLLHQRPPCTPPLQAKQKTAYYAGVTMIFGVGVKSWFCHLRTGGTCSVIEPPCLRVSISNSHLGRIPWGTNVVADVKGLVQRGSSRNLNVLFHSILWSVLTVCRLVSLWQLSLVLFHHVLEHLCIRFISLFVWNPNVPVHTGLPYAPIAPVLQSASC